ncbi:MAG: hypothetical protein AAB794_03640 [Patescibacteria group bacterium]
MMDLAGNLPLQPILSGDTHIARCAPQKPAEWPRVGFGGWPTPSTAQDGVRPVPKVFRNERFVLALVYLAGVAKVSVIKRILQDERYSGDIDTDIASGADARLF